MAIGAPPIHCLNCSEGLTTLILGAMHGDEYEGSVAINALAHAIDIKALVGWLILLLALDLPAMMAGTRLTPEDELNLTRVFPGNPLGSLTQRISNWLSETMMPLSDQIVDRHSGGRILNFAPSVLVPETASQLPLVAAAGLAFGAPFTVLINEDHSPMTIDAVAENLGKVLVSLELGGAGMLTRYTAILATDGLPRMVAGLGHLLVKEDAPASQYVRLPTSDKFLICDDDMIFVPTVDLGDAVCEGDILGHGWFLDLIDTEPKVYFAPYDGWVLCFVDKGCHEGGMLLPWLHKTQLKAWLHD